MTTKINSYCFNFVSRDLKNIFYCIQGKTCPEALRKLCILTLIDDVYIGKDAISICAGEHYAPKICECELRFLENLLFPYIIHSEECIFSFRNLENFINELDDENFLKYFDAMLTHNFQRIDGFKFYVINYEKQMNSQNSQFKWRIHTGCWEKFKNL